MKRSGHWYFWMLFALALAVLAIVYVLQDEWLKAIFASVWTGIARYEVDHP